MSQAVGTIDSCFAGGSGHCGAPKQATNGPWLTGSHGANTAANGPYATFGRSSSFRGTSPSQVFMMSDESQWSINDGGLATDCNLASPGLIDYPSSAHNGGCGMSFCDGHAEMHHWQGSAIQLHGSPPGAPHIVSAPADIADVNWLAQNTSVKIK
jgi:prepilin-type processing-associated H-X9-DG protein